jgi:two-component system, NarL family, nitrate/nitrite response regulator NarL
MTILLGSSNRAVIKRWQGLLVGNSTFAMASTLRELLELCAETEFDLVIIHRPLVDVAAFTELRKQSPLTKLFLLSDQPDEEEGLTFLKLGIVGYGNTYISPARLTEAVRIVSTGGVWLGQKVIQHLIQETYTKLKEPAPAQAEDVLSDLTKSERKIAELVAQGHSNLEIAADLDITERTVKAHLTSIYEKTKTGNRLNLALLINRL